MLLKLLSITIFFLLFSCNKSEETIELVHKFPNQVWTSSETVEFIFEPKNIDKDYSIEVVVEVNENYVFSNILLSLSILAPNDGIRKIDIDAKFLDENNVSVSEKIDGGWRIQYPAMRRTAFSIPGQNKITLTHHMPYYSLNGITKIGLNIKELEDLK